jgi:VNT family MFS transporter (synaptic vesicle glycoprotein 2)
LDIDEKNDVLIYLVSFLGSLAVLPGNIISALFMEKIGRVKIIGELVCIGQSTMVIGFYDFNCIGSYN